MRKHKEGNKGENIAREGITVKEEVAYWSIINNLANEDPLVARVMGLVEKKNDVESWRPGGWKVLHDSCLEACNQYYDTMRYARKVDAIDRVVGPFAAGLYLGSPLGTGLFGLAALIEIAEIGLLKVPFIARYAAKTHDWKGAAGFLAAETALYFTPFGRLGDAVDLYRRRTESFIVKQAYENYLTKSYLERETK